MQARLREKRCEKRAADMVKQDDETSQKMNFKSTNGRMTLQELTDLVKEVTPEAKRVYARLSFVFVFPQKNGRYVVRQVGKTFAHGYTKVDDDKALALLGFRIGDYLDVAIF